MRLRRRDDPLTAARRAAADVGLAALFGGNLFGRLAMHPALEGVCGPEERGQVVNAAWRRYGTVNSLALAAVVGNWAATRGDESGPLARAADAAVGAVTVTGVASAIAGVRFGSQAPGGAVPLESGSEPASQTPPDAARNKRVLNALGAASAASEAALLVVESLRRRS
jgi:hypothetical protein